MFNYHYVSSRPHIRTFCGILPQIFSSLSPAPAAASDGGSFCGRTAILTIHVLPWIGACHASRRAYFIFLSHFVQATKLCACQLVEPSNHLSYQRAEWEIYATTTLFAPDAITHAMGCGHSDLFKTPLRYGKEFLSFDLERAGKSHRNFFFGVDNIMHPWHH